MIIKIDAANLPAICTSSLFMDRRARRDGTVVFEAPFIAHPFPIANSSTDAQYDDILGSAHTDTGVVIDPDCVAPDSRCNYVTKKLLWNRPIFNANGNDFSGQGKDNDSARTPLQGTSDTAQYIVPRTLTMSSAASGAILDYVHGKGDGASSVLALMPAALRLAQNPMTQKVSVVRNGESPDWRTPAESVYSAENTEIGLAGVVGESLSFWDEPEGDVGMENHVSPWVDKGGGRAMTHIYLNQWEPGKGMRAKKKNRGIDVSFTAGDWDQLDRDAIDWLNDIYDSKSGTYAGMMGLSINPACPDESVSAADERNITKYAYYNAFARVYALRLLEIFWLAQRVDLYEPATRERQLAPLFFKSSSDSAEAAMLKALLQSASDDRYALGSMGAPGTIFSEWGLAAFKTKDSDWTKVSVVSGSSFRKVISFDLFDEGFQPAAADTDVNSFMESALTVPVASLFGKQKHSTWSDNTQMKLFTGVTDLRQQECPPLDHLPLCSRAQLNAALYNETGVRVSATVTSAQVDALYSPAMIFAYGAGQGIFTNFIHAMFEDGIPTNTADWAHELSGELMWWWCGVYNGFNN